MSKTLVFIHGFCESSSMWYMHKELFSDKYAVHTIDLPGFGKSQEDFNDVRSIEHLADSVYSYCKSNRIVKPVIIGHSLGGYVMMALEEKCPNLSQALIFLHSHVYEDTEERKEGRNKTIEFIDKQGVPKFIDSFVPLLFYHKNRKGNQPYIDFLVSEARKLEEEILIHYSKIMRDRESKENIFADLEKPILMIAGDQDTAVPAKTSLAHQRLNKQYLRFHMLKDAGHMGFIEKFDESNRIILSFLEDL
ncbi:MAG: alpha/beta hydrolase [Cyclobacteriaceae bacterium]|nr:alpha/beta hydrolase [Cyclobacteriaceae bacterium]MCH8517631.1 alpha/beta hydrolase [Cyclobacteriaceae bacterium]